MKNRLRLQPDKRLAFLQGFLRNPHLVGSVVPSSRFLERRLIDIAGVADARTVVELGPGTGGTTRAILRTLPVESRLLAIDIEARFVSLLRDHPDPRLIAHLGSAADLGEILAQHGLPRPDVVVSGVPFSTMPAALGRRVLEAVWSSLAPGGRFVAYQFRDRVAELNREIAGRPDVSVELLNVPPMRIYRWRKAGDAESTHAA
jgi:phosphatidylethanolamine/phosphatidyl-N-methylethanolamine N-methyltransferase